MESVLSTVNEKGVGEERGRGHCPVVFRLFSKKKVFEPIFDTGTIFCQNNGCYIYVSQDQTEKVGSVLQKVDI